MANNLEKLISAYAAQLQDIETALLEVLTETRLANASGVQLDVIGAIVGRERSSENDDRYRELIIGQIRINLASGTISEVLQIVSLVVGPAVELRLIEGFPAGFEIIADQQTLPPGQGDVVASLVKDAKAAGVRGLFRWYETDPVFRFDGSGFSRFDGGYFFATSL